METPKWYEVADLNSIPLREGRRVVYKNYSVALFNLGEEYFAVDSRCPHKAGPLADGIVSGKSVYCPLHNWKIGLDSGCVLSGGKGKVKVYPVKVIDGKICIDFSASKFCDPPALSSNGEAG